MTRIELLAARSVSGVFRPGYYPTVVFLVLLNCTFLSMLPLLYRAWIMLVVWALTFALPWLGVRIYLRALGHSLHDLKRRHLRITPYVINLLSTLLCAHYMWRLRLPAFLLAVLAVSITLQCLCTLITLRWKISVHCAAAGTLISVLTTYGPLFGADMLWWVSGAVVVNGLVGTSRMMLRQHTLAQVAGGTVVGFLCGLLGIWII